MADRGGFRENAGRKSAFGGVEKKFSMGFTADGLRALAAIEKRTKLSRNNILAQLARDHAAALTFTEPGLVYPGKDEVPLAIRMPLAEGQLLEEARARTQKSYSDLGEALVRRYGDTTTFPAPFRIPKRRRRRRARARR